MAAFIHEGAALDFLEAVRDWRRIVDANGLDLGEHRDRNLRLSLTLGPDMEHDGDTLVVTLGRDDAEEVVRALSTILLRWADDEVTAASAKANEGHKRYCAAADALLYGKVDGPVTARIRTCPRCSGAGTEVTGATCHDCRGSGELVGGEG